MSGRLISDSKNSKMLLKNLMDSVKECQNVYGKNKTLLATEKDVRVQRLCTNWETALSHGLKTSSVFKNIVSGNLTTEVQSSSFWDFASQHLTGHEKERFSTLRYVYTDQGKVRALIRAALNERALERYILIWLNDANGINTHFDSWALIRDTEASNLLPSIAAGLGSILFAITVDCPELNVAPPSESIPILQRRQEPIIAVPTVSSSSERKSIGSKRVKQIISFEDDENALTTLNNNLLKSSTPPTATSLADACLKYQEKERLAKEKVQKIKTDSTYERIMQTTDITSNVIQSNEIETDYIEPESPTSIKMYSPIASETYAMLSKTFDPKEIEATISKSDSNTPTQSPPSDTTSTTSHSTTHSSTSASVQNHISSQPSQSESINSMHSSMDSVSNSLTESVPSPDEIKQKQRIEELEQRCMILEEKVSTLTLENARLKSLHHNLVANRQSSRHFSISIPRVVLQRHENSNKKYFAYEIQIVPLVEDGEREKWSILRRYSEFHRLHKYLQKDNIMIKTLDFPPKKSFGNMNAEFVELRRQRLQVYLLSVISLSPELSKCNTRTQLEHAFPFFKQSHRL